ncbi:MAG: TerB family tellurite resistance protein [Betaproteobacteria bacterium]|nr:TerB family tellurite resistance protein [Betaproteobacteria bacterium]NBY04130.1 TerB family tellurite resistance protein [Betaproteobacteria bacterium]
MGLFDVFKSEPLKLSPKLALAVGVLYMMAADGEIESEEIGQLQSVVGGDQDLISSALKYLRSVKYEQFLADAAALLNERQKLCLLINMADSLLSDGRAEQSEQQAFGHALSAFGVTEDAFKGYLETLAIKNDRAIFN